MMRTIRFNRKLLAYAGVCSCMCFIEYILLSLFFQRSITSISGSSSSSISSSSSSSSNSIICKDRDQAMSPFDRAHNVLGDNFVRDFYRYKCESSTRYGGSNPDPMYRIDG